MRGTSKAPAAKAKPKPMNLKRLRTRFGVPAALIAVLVLALPGSAPAALGDTEEFFEPTQPTKPHSLVEGSDGNVWYTDSTVAKIGKVTPSGTVEEFSPGLTGPALNITAGPESKLWFTEKTAKKIGSINTSGGGLAECTVAGEPESIAAGSDGNLWFTYIPTGEAGVRKIAKMTPGCSITDFTPGVTAGFASTSVAATIIAGGDGNLYYGTIGATKLIGKITLPGETFTEFTVAASNPNQPHSLTYGGDGRIWFAANNATEERIGAVTPSGTVTYYNTGPGTNPVAGASFTGFTTGADGNVWVREPSSRLEKQKVTIKTSGPEDLGGTYKLKFNGDETAPIAFNASALATEEALGALPSIGGVANVKVVATFTGGATVERTIEFEGKLNRTDVPLLECVPGELTGTGVTCTVETTQTAITQKLYRFKPNGEFTIFPLKARTLGVTPAASTLGKNGTIVSGPNNNLWFTTAGDSKFGPEPGVTTAIGEFDIAFEPPVEGPPLTIVIEEGSGTVVSDPAGIECTGEAPHECTTEEIAEDETVTLTASPAAGYLFKSWKYCDSTTVIPGVTGVKGRQCTIKLTPGHKPVGVKFTKAYDVTVNRVGTGLGKMQSTPGGVLCLANCESTSAAFKENTAVTLKAVPSKNFEFVEWTGDCSGSELTCPLGALGEDKEAGAEFAEVAKFDLTLSKSGGGQGTVKGKPAGINCGLTCSSQAAAYYENAEVELTVTTGKGSSFGGWSTGAGTCTGTTNPCKVTMSSAKALTAEFK